MKQNKKGMIGMLLFFVALFLIMIIGFIAVMGISIIGYASEELTPIMKEVGVSSDNPDLENAMNFTFDTTDSVVQGMPWVLSFTYVLALIFSIVFVVSYRENPHPAFIGFFIALMFLLVLGSIVMSNMYQDIYNGNDFLGERLQAQPLMSYMMLYSPFIMTLIAFVAGAFMFTGRGEDAVGI